MSALIESVFVPLEATSFMVYFIPDELYDPVGEAIVLVPLPRFQE